jgi:hypothetical protein
MGWSSTFPLHASEQEAGPPIPLTALSSREQRRIAAGLLRSSDACYKGARSTGR